MQKNICCAQQKNSPCKFDPGADFCLLWPSLLPSRVDITAIIAYFAPRSKDPKLFLFLLHFVFFYIVCLYCKYYQSSVLFIRAVDFCCETQWQSCAGFIGWIAQNVLSASVHLVWRNIVHVQIYNVCMIEKEKCWLLLCITTKKPNYF